MSAQHDEIEAVDIGRKLPLLRNSSGNVHEPIISRLPTFRVIALTRNETTVLSTRAHSSFSHGSSLQPLGSKNVYPVNIFLTMELLLTSLKART